VTTQQLMVVTQQEKYLTKKDQKGRTLATHSRKIQINRPGKRLFTTYNEDRLQQSKGR
jgi:hypothetical protein